MTGLPSRQDLLGGHRLQVGPPKLPNFRRFLFALLDSIVLQVYKISPSFRSMFSGGIFRFHGYDFELCMDYFCFKSILAVTWAKFCVMKCSCQGKILKRFHAAS